MSILPQAFYNRSTLRVAQDLLGCFLVKKFTGGERRFKITQTEAYVGPKDKASHASRGLTERNSVMFGEPGIIYVYFAYGMHYILNIVTERKGYPAAALIRAVEEMQMRNAEWFFKCGMRNAECEGKNKALSKKQIPNSKFPIPHLKTDGPAKLTKALGIDKNFNGLPVYVKKYGLWIEGRVEVLKKTQIGRGKRIGIDYAGKYRDKLWRFILK